MIIATDFDGTLCAPPCYPRIGQPNRALIQLLRIARQDGHKLILWTCRRDQTLDQAIEWCQDQGLDFDAVNTNLPERIAEYGCDTRKISADLYIDDLAISLGPDGLPIRTIWTQDTLKRLHRPPRDQRPPLCASLREKDPPSCPTNRKAHP